MELVRPVRGGKDGPARHHAVAELRDVGEQLMYLLVRYEGLVTRITDGRGLAPDLIGRVDWLNLQLAAAADQLQEIILLGSERTRTVPRMRSRARTSAMRAQLVVHDSVEEMV